MKKVLLIALALVALFAFVSCSEITPAGTYKASETVGENLTVKAQMTLKTDGKVVLDSISVSTTSDNAIIKASADTLNTTFSKLTGEIGTWTHDGKTVSINGVDAEYNGTSLKYKVAEGYTLTFKR